MLQQFTVTDVNGLGHHVRVGVLGHARIQKIRVILGIDVLLDPATGATNSHSILRYTKALDEVLFHHQRRFATYLKIIVSVSASTGGIDNRVAFFEHFRLKGSTTHAALSVPNGNTAFKMEE